MTIPCDHTQYTLLLATPLNAWLLLNKPITAVLVELVEVLGGPPPVAFSDLFYCN